MGTPYRDSSFATLFARLIPGDVGNASSYDYPSSLGNSKLLVMSRPKKY